MGGERIACRPASELHRSWERLPVHQPDAVDLGGDHQVGMLTGRGDGVDATHSQGPNDGLPKMGDVRIAPCKHSSNGAPKRRPPGPAHTSHPPRDVDRDHGSLAFARHRLNREIVEHSAVDEQLAVLCGDRWKDARNREACVDSVYEWAEAMHDSLAPDEVAAHTEEAQR